VRTDILNDEAGLKKKTLGQNEALSKKVIRSGVWVFALRITGRGLGLIKTIILARLLAPEDFGLMGTAMLAISILESFSQTGFQAALIQKKEDIQSYLDTAWTASVIRGIILFLILFLSAPLIAKFFKAPQAIWIIKIISISTLLSGLINIKILFFQKEFEFRKQFIYEFSTTIVGLTVSVSLALILRSVWALVWGGMAAHFARLFMSYILWPYRPRIRLEKDKFLDLFVFGRWVLGSGILVFLITQGDDIFVGKMMGITALGLYQMAYLISNLSATEITHVISQVTFPAYSKLQDDLPKMREAYKKVLQITTFLSFPLSGLIVSLCHDFTQIFLGNKWIPMVPILKVMALAGLARSMAATTGPLFHGIGKPGIDTIWQLGRLVILLIFIYPFTVKWGLTGTAIAVFLSYLASTLKIFMVIRIDLLSWKSFLMIITLPILTTMIMISSLTITKLFFSVIGIYQFLMILCISLIIYAFCTYLLDDILNYKIINIIKRFYML